MVRLVSHTVFTAAGCPILVLHDKNHPQMVFCGQLDKLSADIWQKDEFPWLFSTRQEILFSLFQFYKSIPFNDLSCQYHFVGR